jgi:hypothetical protein
VFVVVNKAEQLAAQKSYEQEALNSLPVQVAIALGLLGTVAVGSGWLVAGKSDLPPSGGVDHRVGCDFDRFLMA